MSAPPPPPAEFRCGFVALVGWTNAGKSTLLNRLVGEKVAAVADAAQTTRNRITAVRTLADRGQLIFVDTPGFHKPRHRMNRTMLEIARRSLDGVDLAVHVVDAGHGPGAGDEQIARLLERLATPRLTVLNKIDLVRPKTRLLPMIERAARDWGAGEVIPLSALSGEGCEVFVERVLAALPVGPAVFPADYLTDQPERVLAAEWIRERLLHRTRQELPHALAVVVERWQEHGDAAIEIEATILVERESQKPIVIGRGGEMLKTVGSEARREIERLLDARVMLRLWVKVRPGWRDDERSLRELGLH